MTTFRLLAATTLVFALGCSSNEAEKDDSAKPAAKNDKAATSPGDKPADPAGDKPADPAGDKPADAAGDKPADPAGDIPADPAGDKPADPAGDKPADPAGDKPATAKPGPMKLKVLPKKWSRKQVKNYMKKEVNRGLGVKCKFCHDPDNFADTSKKAHKAGLEMIRMQNRINKDYFGGKKQVSCFTCHNGQAEI